MSFSVQAPNDDHMAEEGELEIRDFHEDDQPRERGRVQRRRSIGSLGGGSLCSAASTRSKSNHRGRSNSAGRLSHRQRSRAMMASPSKYGRNRRRDRENNIGDSDVRSTATTVADDLSDQGDNDSNHQLRRRLSEMTEMASSASPSVYRQRKQRLKKRLSNEKSMIDFVSDLTMSPDDDDDDKADAVDTPKDQGDDSTEFDSPSVHSASIDRQQRREQAALEEVMSMVAKTKKSSSNRRSARLDASNHSTISNTHSGIPEEMSSPVKDPKPVRRTQSLNVGASTRRPSRRSGRPTETMSQKKERRDIVKGNLGKFMEDDY